MKLIRLYTGLFLLGICASCGNSNSSKTPNAGDTGVLVSDTANRLNARPINDTTLDTPIRNVDTVRK